MKTQDVGYLTLKSQAEAKVRWRGCREVVSQPLLSDGTPAQRTAARAIAMFGSKRGSCALKPPRKPPRPAPHPAPPRPQKVERLQQSLHLIGAPAANRHIVFVDDEKEAQRFDAAAHFDTAPELLDRQFNRPRLSQLADARAVSAGEGAAAAVKRIEK